jgi:hypothetical protein
MQVLIYEKTATGQLWLISSTTIQLRLKVQLNSVLFAKTLVRKDVVSTAPPPSSANENGKSNTETQEKEKDEDNFSSKAQIMTLMTTDVDRVCGFVRHIFSLIGL